MRFQRVCEILDEAVGGPGESIGAHGAFWRGLTRDEFVAQSPVGRPLVVVGDGPASNLVRALKGQAPFGRDLIPRPPGASIRRMPAGNRSPSSSSGSTTGAPTTSRPRRS